MNLHGRRIHIVGSAADDADERKLSYAHALIAKLVVALTQAGCNFVIPFGKEPRLKDRSDGPSIIFDWTIAEGVGQALENGTAPADGPNGRLIATVATGRTNDHIPENRKALYSALKEAHCLKTEFLDPGWTSGAHRRSRLAQLGDILICLSGGQGVEQLAIEYSSRGKPVIPLDLQLGASGDDGSGGGARLFDRALAAPARFVKVNESEDAADLLDQTRTDQASKDSESVVKALMRLMRALRPPQAFYVRLLNSGLVEYTDVENFFRTTVDSLVTELGYEPLQMGRGTNEFAWMNQAIFDSLHHSQVVVVDLTGLRPNCFMELGYAFGNNQRVIITAQKGTNISFDASALEAFMWDPGETDSERLSKFREHWMRNIDMPPLVNPIKAI